LGGISGSPPNGSKVTAFNRMKRRDWKVGSSTCPFAEIEPNKDTIKSKAATTMVKDPRLRRKTPTFNFGFSYLKSCLKVHY
jgi:hypothetical protein